MTTSAEVTPTDITNEEYRVYSYANGAEYRIDGPQQLYIFEGKSGWTQRIVDANGVTHRPSPGFVAIRWKPTAGTLAFNF